MNEVCVGVCVCRYCERHGWSSGSLVLVRPYDAMFMSYESYEPGSGGSAAVLEWLRGRLLSDVRVIRSPSELQHHLTGGSPSVRVLVVTLDGSVSTVPLFLPLLAVLLDGRVTFALVADSIMTSHAAAAAAVRHGARVLVSCDGELYWYGSGESDCLTLPALRLLLTLLSPAGSDLLDMAVTLSLMLLCLQPCLVPAGLRLISVVCLSVRLCFVLLLYCFFVSYVIPEHELHELLDPGLLPYWRSCVVLTWFGDRLRRDWLRYTRLNFTSFVLSYAGYLLLVAHCFYSRRRRMITACLYSSDMMTPDNDDDDDDELRESVEWYTWQQFGVPHFWHDQHSLLNTGSAGGTWSVSGCCAGETCALCSQSLSHSVCRLAACQHLFHLSCLAHLIYTQHSHSSSSPVCPACHQLIFTHIA